MKYIAALLLPLFLLSSCSEDSTAPSTNDGKPYLEVLPNSINVGHYESFDLKYRVANFPFEDQVKIAADYGNGVTTDKVRIPGSTFSYYYTEPGNYTITLSAYDSFSDTLLATKSVPVTVAESQLSVSIYPADLDTVFIKNTSEDHRVRFRSTTNVEVAYLKYEWTTNGVTAWGSTAGNLFDVYFETEGTYKVAVRMIDGYTNKELATDSTNVTVHFK
ncbi:MAG TPA: hypothetical protein VIX80_06665 [Candidatus Kapabacteria bacterium]